MEEEKIYLEEKESSLRKLVKFGSFIVSVYGLIIAAKNFVEKMNAKFESKNKEGGKKRQVMFLDGKQIKAEEAPADMEIYMALSGAILDLTNVKFSGETTLTIYGFASGISVKVPPMVRVVGDSLEFAGGFANLVPTYESDDLPVLRVSGCRIMCGTEIKIGH